MAQGPQRDDVALFIVLVENGPHVILYLQALDLPVYVLMAIANAKYQLFDAVPFEDFDMALQQRFTTKAQQYLRWMLFGRRSKPGTDPSRQHNCLHLRCSTAAGIATTTTGFI